jgi:hypothetical protein
MNLAGPADWNTELPFVDVFRLSRPWISQRQGQPWGRGPELQLDEHGWVKALEPDCWAETPLCTIDGGHYPSGRYTVLYEGQGRLEVVHAAKVAERAPGRLLIDVEAAKGGFFLQLRETDPADPVRNLRVIVPGFAETYEKDPWHPAFLQRWQGFAVLRFMDFMLTNGSAVKTWADRPALADATCTRKGVPLELMLASQGANPYVSERIVEFQDASASADVLAIAPYLAMNVKPDEAAAVLALGWMGCLGACANRSCRRRLSRSANSRRSHRNAA